MSSLLIRQMIEDRQEADPFGRLPSFVAVPREWYDKLIEEVKGATGRDLSQCMGIDFIGVEVFPDDQHHGVG